MTTTASPVRAATTRLVSEPELRCVLTVGACIALLVGAGLAGIPRLATLVTVGLVLVVGVRRTGLALALLAAVAVWALWTGFDEHAFGYLTFDSSDLDRLGVLVLVAALAATIGSRIGRVRR